jgi:RNA polymerase sigma-70 factor (subfamily 1)
MTPSPVSKRAWLKRFNRLFGKVVDGEDGSLFELFNLYRPYLLATAHARLEAQLKAKAGPSDLVQETFIAAKRAWKDLKEKPGSEEEVRLWLRNVLLARLKALRRRYYRAQSRSLRRERSLDQSASKDLLDELLIQKCETPRGTFDRRALTKWIEDALNRLTPAYRQVIVWRNHDGRSFADIGQRMERSSDAARMLWRRAIAQLKKELDGINGDG